MIGQGTYKPEGKLRRRAAFEWPASVLGPAPGLREINLLCWGLFFGFVVAPIFIPIWKDSRTGTAFRHLLPVDFTYFYGIGRIVNEYSFARLYDYNLQLQVFNQIYPLTDHTYGPSPYPPFVALFFSLFARMPFFQAYLLWVSVLLVLYLWGISFVARFVFPREPLKASLVYCFAAGFYPFFICTLKLGQLSGVAVFSVGLAITLERRYSPFLSGLALSILAYKPTLLLLIVPMLLITRRFRAFLGFAAGTATLVSVTTLIAGIGIWPTYFHFLAFFRQASVVDGRSLLQLWEYVDFTSLSFGIPHGRSAIGLALLASITVAVLAVSVLLQWKSTKGNRSTDLLVWASSLTWTLLLNVYVPIWDSILVTIGLLLTIAAVRDLKERAACGVVVFLAIAIFAATWNLAAGTTHRGTLVATLLLFILGVVQLRLLHRAIYRGLPELQSESAIS